MELGAALQQARQRLVPYSASPQLDAEILLAAVLKVSRSFLYAHDEEILQPKLLNNFFSFIERRAKGEPIAYLVGYQEFWSLKLQVTPATLIPRADTETLVTAALQQLPEHTAITIADLGTGSGAIALALASMRPQWQLLATDTSAAALTIAKANAQRLRINNIAFMQGDWCTALPQQRLAAIVSNPPYIDPTEAELLPAELTFEPPQALFASDQGLSALIVIAQQAKDYLQTDGWLLLEHGFDQAECLAKKLQQLGYQHINLYRDLANLPRVTAAQWCIS